MARSRAVLVSGILGLNIRVECGFLEEGFFWFLRYNGRKTDPPNPFPPEMEAACVYIEKVVNEELSKRQRYPLEYGGNEGEGTEGYTWRANVAASNCYEGAKESVGFHSDQLTYLGPYPTIASLSLGTYPDCICIVCSSK